MAQLFCCMISEEKFPPLTFNGKKKRHQRAKLGDAAPSRYWKIYYVCYKLNKNTESTLKHDSVEEDV